MRAALALLVAGCAAGKSIDKLPLAEIDRPYTLPDGVDSWSIGTIITVPRDRSTTADAVGDLYLRWGISLADDWELGLLGPFSLSHQLANDGVHRAGVTLSLAAGLFISGGTDTPTRADVQFAPALHLEDRLRLSRAWAWEFGVTGRAARWTYQPRWAASGEFATGPMWQATQTLAFEALGSIAWARDYTAIVSPALPYDHLQTAVMAGASWSASRQWTLALRAGSIWASNANGYNELWGSFSAIDYW